MFVEQFARQAHAKRREEAGQHRDDQERMAARKIMVARGMPEWARDVVIECATEARVSPL